MTGLILSSKRFAGFVKESSYGVPITTGIRWLPVKNPKTSLQTKFQKDQGLRGVAAATFGEYPGVQNGQFSYDLDWYITDTPIILPNIIGPDTAAQIGTSTFYTHTFNLASGEPASLTLHDYDATDQWEYAGSMLSQASFKLDSEGNLSCSVQGQGFPPLSEAVSTPSFATEAYFLGWEAAVTIGGTPNAHLVTMQLDLKRKLTARWSANNTQKPSQIFVGPLEVTGKLTFDVIDDTELNYYVNNTQPIVVVNLTQPSSSNAIKFTMSKCAFTTGEKNTGKDYVQVDADIEGVWNSTDAGPIAVVVTNTQSAAY